MKKSLNNPYSFLFTLPLRLGKGCRENRKVKKKEVEIESKMNNYQFNSLWFMLLAISLVNTFFINSKSTFK